MKNSLIGALTLGIIFLAFKVSRLSTHLEEVTAKHSGEVSQTVPSLELQEKCATQAAKAFKIAGWSQNDKLAGTHHTSM